MLLRMKYVTAEYLFCLLEFLEFCEIYTLLKVSLSSHGYFTNLDRRHRN